jgi:hypothetical protein
MNENGGEILLMGVIIGCLLILLAQGVANLLPAQVVKQQQVEAVSVGAAEWVVNPEGKVTFQWKEQK